MTLRLDWCSVDAANFACKSWHYSRTRPTGKNNYIGVWEDGKFIGCLIFGLGATPSLCKPYGLGVFEVCELVRVALTKHRAPVSRMISIGLKLLKAKNPGLRLCVSFADPFQEHVGGIYQAGNWTYTGTSGAGEMYQLPDGKMVHPRQYTGVGWNAPKAVPRGAVKIKTPGKYRYLMPLDDAMRKQIEPLRKPYPKKSCAGSTVASAPAIQAGEGGAEPTPALHIDTPRVDDGQE